MNETNEGAPNYRPTNSDIIHGENMMTDEQRQMSEIREKETTLADMEQYVTNQLQKAREDKKIADEMDKMSPDDGFKYNHKLYCFGTLDSILEVYESAENAIKEITPENQEAFEKLARATLKFDFYMKLLAEGKHQYIDYSSVDQFIESFMAIADIIESQGENEMDKAALKLNFLDEVNKTVCRRWQLYDDIYYAFQKHATRLSRGAENVQISLLNPIIHYLEKQIESLKEKVVDIARQAKK